MRNSWYRDGLRFSCTQCGHCCTGTPGYVWVGRREIRLLALALELSVAEFGSRYLRKADGRYSLIEKPNGDCIFYQKGCTVYEARPRQCRTFPFWPETLKTRCAWDEAKEDCPGLDEGRLYALEEIRLIRDGKDDATES